MVSGTPASPRHVPSSAGAREYTLSRLTESEEYGPGLRPNSKYIMQNESDVPVELIKNIRYLPVKRTQNTVVKEYATSTTESSWALALRVAREKHAAHQEFLAEEERLRAAAERRTVPPVRSHLRPESRPLQVVVGEVRGQASHPNVPRVRATPPQPRNQTQAANQATTNQPPLPPSSTPANPPLPPSSTPANPPLPPSSTPANPPLPPTYTSGARVARTAQPTAWYNLPPPLPPSIEVRSPPSPSLAPASPSLLPAYTGGAWPARTAPSTAWYNLPPPLPPSDEVKPPLAPSPAPTSPPPAYTGSEWFTRNPQPPIWYLLPTHDCKDMSPLSAAVELKPPPPPASPSAPAKRKREQDENYELDIENNIKIRK